MWSIGIINILWGLFGLALGLIAMPLINIFLGGLVIYLVVKDR